MKRNYLVYKLQCPVNGKIYIGVTCQRPEFRWRNGKKYSGDLKADIEKYGWESFSKEILETGLLTAEAAKREKEYIKKYSTKAVLYNATAGGEVRLDCDIDRMAEKMRGRKLTPLAKEHISKARKGIVFSDSHREHLSVSHLGNPGYWTGKKRDAETMKKVSQKLSKQIRCRVITTITNFRFSHSNHHIDQNTWGEVLTCTRLNFAGVLFHQAFVKITQTFFTS